MTLRDSKQAATADNRGWLLGILGGFVGAGGVAEALWGVCSINKGFAESAMVWYNSGNVGETDIGIKE